MLDCVVSLVWGADDVAGLDWTGLTGIPAAVTMDSCVGEKTRWPASLAAVKRCATSAERGSESPSCMAFCACVVGGE